MLKIISVPDKILSSSTRRVEKIDDKIKKLLIDMEKILLAQNDPKGVGLSANQVGVDLSIFIIKPSEKAKTKVFINPKILKYEMRQDPSSKKRKSESVRLEGCLSIPRIWGAVERANKILLEYQDLTLPTASVKRGWFQGLEAVIIQHEMDHLCGVLFTQRVIEQNRLLYEEKNGELEKIDY